MPIHSMPTRRIRSPPVTRILDRESAGTGLSRRSIQRALPRAVGRRVEIEHLKIVDAVECGVRVHAARRFFAGGCRMLPPCTKLSRWRLSVRRMRYCTVTDKRASTDSTSTASTVIRSASHCCKAPCTRNCVVAARLGAVGANTSSRKPLPSRPHHPLARCGECHLLDQAANPGRFVVVPRAATAVELVGSGVGWSWDIP